jgi:hypothetical protein
MVKRIARSLALLLMCALAAVLSLVWMFCAVLANSARGQRLAVSFDQLANTALGGDEDETISSRAGKAAREGKWWACRLCRWLDRFDPNHCENNIEQDEGKRVSE